MVIMMNFDEPDLEDLIQHDLHSEMNKILDESGPENSVSHLTACSMPQVIPSNSCSSLTSQFNGSNQLKADAADTQTTIESKSNDIPDLQIVHIGSLKHETSESNTLFIHSAATTSANSEKVQADFSGHFSVERFPTAALDEQQRVGMECLVQKSEQNDLSNLAWLTTVDVQQTLQRDGGIVLPEIDTDPTTVVSSMQQTQTSAGGSLPFPSPASKLPGFQAHPTPAPLNGESLENRIQARFTPIQPHPNPEVPHQRYMLHGGHHAAMRHRNLLPHSERPGPHRFTHHGAHTSFHPYPPPPPYGSSGYGHEPPFHYGRGQGPSQKVYPKPVYSYSCLIAMSLTKSKSGCLPVSDIYSFMMENFPYFKTAPDGWKNSVRHNLSLNKCFEKVEKPNGTQRKGCLWALNPAKVSKMEEEVQKWKRKDPESIRRSMSNPDEFDREMEQLRRADEEAARRRMISMTSHGLSLATPPPHPFHHHPHPHHPHFNPHHMNEATRPHMHPSGSVSMPTTPQHLSPQAGQYRHPMTPVQRSGSTSAYGNNGNNGNQSFAHPPRQLFQFPPDPNGLHLGAPDISSTPSSSGKLPSILATPFKALPHLMSPNSSSSTSSGNSASFFGPLADTLSSHDLNDLDLDSSLADLSALQGPFWDETASALTPSGAGDGLLGTDTPFDDPEAPQRGATQQVGESPSSTSSSSANFHVVGPAGGHHSVAGDPSGPGVFPGRFAGELGGYFTGSNNKPVLMH